jgi:two-component system response regulator FixJ
MTNSHKWLTIVPHIRPSGDSSKADIPNSQLSKDEEFTMSEKAQVYVVDPDVEARTIFRSFSATLGVPVSDCASASDFLSYDLDTISGCLVIDSWLPDMDGVTLLRRIASEDTGIPVIMTSATADVRLAVRAMKAGAIEFLEKPFSYSEMLSCVRRALHTGSQREAQGRERARVSEQFTLLTERQREVLELMVAGKANTIIAEELGISHRTVESHRAQIREKLRLHTLPAIVKFAMAAGMTHQS